MDPPTQPVRRSGIPRPVSRLPVPSSTKRPAPQTAGIGASAGPNIATRTTTNNAPRTSTIGSVRASTNARAPVGRFSTVSGRSTVRPTVTSQTFNKPSVPPPEDDDLGDLNAFRASSRASSRQGFREPIREPQLSAKPAEKLQTRKSRPSLSDRTMETLAAVAAATPERRRSSFFMPDSPLGPPSRPGSSLSRPGTSDGSSIFPLSLTPAKRTNARPSTARPSTARATPQKPVIAPRATPAGRRSVTTSAIPPKAATTPRATPVKKPALLQKPAPREDAVRKISDSSSALRAQIAKAKQEARRTSAKGGASFDAWNVDTDDPFNQRPTSGGNAGLLRKRIDAGRSDGRLNIAGMGLAEIPDDVLKMYEYDPDNNAAWSESVDLVRFNAADNELKSLPDNAFPDAPLGDDEEGGVSNQFGGLEVLDLHGNKLSSLPKGLRRLEHLTSLNLSRNKLSSIDIITEIPNLRELRLGENSIEQLPESVSQLSNLEVLELNNNKLFDLPANLRELIHLRVLNVSNNQLKDLNINLLAELPLVQLSASKNRLSGTLFLASITLSRLQNLDISCNGFDALSQSKDDRLELPSLQILNISFNRISALPDISSWTNLHTLLAEDNKLTELPKGFTSLKSFRSANLTGNDIIALDPMISLMEQLETLTVAANPLRDRKFLTMATEDIKSDLKARLEAPNFDGLAK